LIVASDYSRGVKMPFISNPAQAIPDDEVDGVDDDGEVEDDEVAEIQDGNEPDEPEAEPEDGDEAADGIEDGEGNDDGEDEVKTREDDSGDEVAEDEDEEGKSAAQSMKGLTMTSSNPTSEDPADGSGKAAPDRAYSQDEFDKVSKIVI
jgi:hypothetical protein